MRKAALFLFTTAAVAMIACTSAMAEIHWQENLRSAHAQAQAEGKLLLLHFYSDNCVWCERLEAGSFQAPQVAEAVSKNFIPVKIHANTNPKLTKMFKVTKFPTDVIVATSGKTLSHSVSPQKSDNYVAMLTNAIPTSEAMGAPLVANATIQSNSAARDFPSPGIVVPPAPPLPSQSVSALAVSAPGLAAPTATSQLEVPSYAKATSPQNLSPNQAVPPTPHHDHDHGDDHSSSGFVLPGGLNPGVQSQLAAARTSNDLTLGMPGPAATNESFGLAASASQPEPVMSAGIAAPSGSATGSLATGLATGVVGDAATTPPIELAMQGFCAVTVINESRWAEGSPQFGVIHLGKLYLFISKDAMQTFLADPVPYTPVLNEIDVVRFFEERKIVQGKRELGVQDPIYHRMFFFADEASRDHFENAYERYTKASIDVMEKAVKDANPGS